MKHTPEPWAADCDVGTWEVWRDFVGEDNRTYATRVCAVVDYENDTAEANAKRIVACVNACRGIPTADLQKLRLVKAVDALNGIDAIGANIDCEGYCGISLTLQEMRVQ